MKSNTRGAAQERKRNPKTIIYSLCEICLIYQEIPTCPTWLTTNTNKGVGNVAAKRIAKKIF